MANSPRKLSVPRGAVLDLDQALEVAARPVEEHALAEQVAGRVLADVARVAGQVEQLAAAAEADLDLVARSRRGRRARLSMRLFWSCAPTLASAQRSCASRPSVAWRLTNASVFGPKSCWPAKLRLAPSPRLDLRRAPPQALAVARRRVRLDRHLLLEDRGVGVLAEVDQRARDEAAAGLAGAAQRMTIGAIELRRRPARGRARRAPTGRARPGRTCRRRAGSSRLDQLDELGQQVGPLAQHVGERVEDDAGVARLGAQRARDDAVLGDLDERRPRPRAASSTTSAASPVSRYGSISSKLRRAQVEVEREELVRLDGQLVARASAA